MYIIHYIDISEGWRKEPTYKQLKHFIRTYKPIVLDIEFVVQED